MRDGNLPALSSVQDFECLRIVISSGYSADLVTLDAVPVGATETVPRGSITAIFLPNKEQADNAEAPAGPPPTIITSNFIQRDRYLGYVLRRGNERTQRTNQIIKRNHKRIKRNKANRTQGQKYMCKLPVAMQVLVNRP